MDIQTNTQSYKPRLGRTLLLMVLAIFLLTEASATTYYVTTTGSASNNGLSWANAKTLQSAISASSSGDSIWVASGTYVPSAYPAGVTSTDTRLYTFHIPSGVSVFGGFDGTETLFSARDHRKNTTTLSGDLGVAGKCYHVVIASSNMHLDGFTIQDGNVNSFSGPTSSGGGIYSSTSFSLANVVIANNSASDKGGGIFQEYSSGLEISNSVFYDNSARYGGGIFFLCTSTSSSPNIINTVFYGNSASFDGGGVYAYGRVKMVNATLVNNSASRRGGGNAGINGGCQLSILDIRNTIYWENTQGGSTMVSGADIYGGGSRSHNLVQMSASTSSWYDSTLLGYKFNEDPQFVNLSDPDGPDNIWMTADDGLRLKTNSPAKDAGDNARIPVGITTDIIGSTRTQNTTLNMGAYEDTLMTCQLSSVLPTASGTYTSAYADTSNGYICYCDTFGHLLLALDTTGTGAEIARDSVSLEIGSDIVTKYTTSGGIITNSSGGSVFNRKWNVAATNQPSSDVEVVYPFTEREYQAIKDTLAGQSTTLSSASDLQLYKLTSAGVFADPHAAGATGIILSNGLQSSTTQWVYSQHSNGIDHLATYKVSSFSGGGGGSGAMGGALPVELLYFQINASKNHIVNLDWATAMEVNNSHFEIERSYDGRYFEPIGQVAGNGNTREIIEYSFIDETIPLNQTIVYYRLNQFDFDDSNEYSDVKAVQFDKSELLDINSVNVYPNPFKDKIYLSIRNEQTEVKLNVTDLTGNIVLSDYSVKEGLNTLDLSHLLAGVYIVYIQGERINQTQRILKK